MKRVMFIVLVCSLFVLNMHEVYAGATGHGDFEVITFEDQYQKLLIDYSLRDYKDVYNNIKGRRFFGWKTFAFTIREEADYVGETLWKYKNMSRGTFEYTYKFEEEVVSTSSINATGGINVKTKKDIKTWNLAFDASAEVSYEASKETTTLEEWELKIDILPYSEAKLQLIGECEVSNGGGKYFAFWINVKKGGWEVINIISQYTYLEEISYIDDSTTSETNEVYEE